jgi:cell division protein FtsI (penicillin-binding protein 3)
LLLASRQVKTQDLAEGSPDHLGEALDVADAQAASTIPAPSKALANAMAEPGGSAVVPAALRQHETVATAATDLKQSSVIGNSQPPLPASPDHLPSSGTVVLDAEQGGIVVPSFAGKSVRGAIELAEDSSLDLDAVGSGLAQDQIPAAGSHVATGSRVTVKFGR